MKGAKKRLARICENRLRENAPMSEITSFGTGGPAKYLLFPQSKEEVTEIFRVSREYGLPLLTLGKGTNILVSDNGFPGIILSTESLNKIEAEDETIRCESGTPLSSILKTSVMHSLSGLEFLAGIPGTAGGAIISNAGLKTLWISESVNKIEVISCNGIPRIISGENAAFRYRGSGLDSFFIFSASFNMKKSGRSEIKKAIASYMQKRKSSQPLKCRSAGSVFKNPPGLFAGALIENCGLKGYSIGDACISEKHANFIINRGTAKSEDIYNLICAIKKQVEKKYNIYLETEIRIIGF